MQAARSLFRASMAPSSFPTGHCCVHHMVSTTPTLVARASTRLPSPVTGARILLSHRTSVTSLISTKRSGGMGTQQAQRQSRMAAAGAGAGGGSSHGSRLAEELVEQAEEQVELLEKRAGAKQAEAHLGPAPASEADGEVASIWYFAYGSNMNRKVFEGRRMIKPAESFAAVLPGWRLEFSQPGLPYSEPSFAAAARQPDATAEQQPNGASAGSNGSSSGGGVAWPDIHGVLHRITPSQWKYVLETEGAAGQDEDSAYQVVEATAVAYGGREIPGVLTLTVSPRVKARLQGREALPSLRYLTLIREGAADYGLAPDYQAWLQGLHHYHADRPGQKVGKAVFSIIAFTSIFPVWAAVRLLRRFTGMQAASNDRASRLMRGYTATMFGVVHGLHEVVRPVLGCGVTLDGGSSNSGGGSSSSGGSKLQ